MGDEAGERFEVVVFFGKPFFHQLVGAGLSRERPEEFRVIIDPTRGLDKFWRGESVSGRGRFLLDLVLEGYLLHEFDDVIWLQFLLGGIF